MTIDELDSLPSGELRAALRACADVDSWVEVLASGRPYADTDVLMQHAVQAAARWSDAEVAHALADHPRIGEAPAAAGAAADHSRAEQAHLSQDRDLGARLAAGNRRYEERFGRVYLVRAAGRSGEEMLDLLEQRLDNDAETEAEETKRQLAEIAVLRLRGLLTDGRPGDAAAAAAGQDET